jgi:cytoskeletal protein CcmA (bactofilin family)
MNAKKNISGRPGVALLVVLIVVMAITITALGFLSQSDVELACGENMVMRTQIDYLAESGLEHARGLILNPQDVSDSTCEYWTGGENLQLVPGSDYYDVTVDRDPNDRCNYNIECISYRRAPDGNDIGRSRLQAQLRLDPCIAYWVGSTTEISSQITINGDAYCAGDLTNNGDINGDVFATGAIIGTNPEGQKKDANEAGVTWPGLVSTDFGPTYYIGSTEYCPDIVDVNVHPVGTFDPNERNLAGIRYCNGDVELSGDVNINGMLVVNGTLRISGVNNVITAEKHFPALLVNGQVVMENGGALVINGLAQIEQHITADPNTTSANIDVTGGLFIHSGDIASPLISVNVTAAPAIAAIETWPLANSARWCPAAGAFFKSVERR